MQQRKNAASRRGIRGRVWRSYDDRKRRKYQGTIEAAFGGFANRYASRISEKKTSTRRRACELWAAAHNIRTMAKGLLNYLWDTLCFMHCHEKHHESQALCFAGCFCRRIAFRHRLPPIRRTGRRPAASPSHCSGHRLSGCSSHCFSDNPGGRVRHENR